RHVAQRWLARLALTAAGAAVALPLVVAGLRSIALVAAALGGTALTAAGAWWVLTRRGEVRALAVVLTAATPLAVLAYYDRANLLWVVASSLGLWALAVAAGRSAMRATRAHEARLRERIAARPRRPFLIMNPRSGGGKVGHFGLKEKAEALGARVVLLDPDHPQDVAELA